MPRGKTQKVKEFNVAVEELHDGVMRKTIITVTAPAADFVFTEPLAKLGKVAPYAVEIAEAVKDTHNKYIQGAIAAMHALPGKYQGEKTEASAPGSTRPNNAEKGTPPKSEKKPEMPHSRPVPGSESSTSSGRINGPVSG